MTDDPVQYSCQPNVAILSTDGYWNGNGGERRQWHFHRQHRQRRLRILDARVGAYDGGASGVGNTLADVAMYYYSADLRANGSTGALGTDVGDNNVPTTLRDTNRASTC